MIYVIKIRKVKIERIKIYKKLKWDEYIKQNLKI